MMLTISAFWILSRSMSLPAISMMMLLFHCDMIPYTTSATKSISFWRVWLSYKCRNVLLFRGSGCCRTSAKTIKLIGDGGLEIPYASAALESWGLSITTGLVGSVVRTSGLSNLFHFLDSFFCFYSSLLARSCSGFEGCRLSLAMSMVGIPREPGHESKSYMKLMSEWKCCNHVIAIGSIGIPKGMSSCSF